MGSSKVKMYWLKGFAMGDITGWLGYPAHSEKFDYLNSNYNRVTQIGNAHLRCLRIQILPGAYWRYFQKAERTFHDCLDIFTQTVRKEFFLTFVYLISPPPVATPKKYILGRIHDKLWLTRNNNLKDSPFDVLRLNCDMFDVQDCQSEV